MKANYHTHTQRCLHAFGSEEDYLRFALEAKLSVLGFSDHAPFPDHDFGYRMPFAELEEYFAAVDRLASSSSYDIIIKKALEIEYIPQYQTYYKRLIEHDKVDYLLLGEHFYADASGEIRNITQATDTSANLDYAAALAEAMQTGYFLMVAHPDLYAMNHFAWDDNCEAAADIIIQTAASTGTVLEFNANGFRRGVQDYPDGRRYMYPHTRFWEKVARTDIPVIIGSDCHEPYQVWDECLSRSQEILKGLGITPIDCLDMDKP